MESSRSERPPVPAPENGKEVLRKKIEELEAKNRLLDAENGLQEWHIEHLEQQHGIDYLTGAASRKVFEHELEQSLKMIRGEIQEKREGIEPLKEISLIFIDIDYFKHVNDTFGHPAGDEALRKVSSLLMESVRESDVVARLGGEELAVLMRGADAQAAARHAEELRAKIEALAFDAYPGLKITASLGVISSDASIDAGTLMKLADKVLYEAKNSGRNRVVVHDET